jgi:hypothetical protein
VTTDVAGSMRVVEIILLIVFCACVLQWLYHALSCSDTLLITYSCNFFMQPRLTNDASVTIRRRC